MRVATHGDFGWEVIEAKERPPCKLKNYRERLASFVHS